MCQSPFFNKVAGFMNAILLKIETLAQMFFYEFYEISKNTFYYRTPLVAASRDFRFNFSAISSETNVYWDPESNKISTVEILFS